MASTDVSKFNFGQALIGVAVTGVVLFIGAWAISKGWQSGKK